jgi:hypothetical protein
MTGIHQGEDAGLRNQKFSKNLSAMQLLILLREHHQQIFSLI